MDRPRFSILVTTYNRADLVQRCLASCLGQRFEDFEVVVVDDGSTDATPQVLAAIDDQRLRIVVHERNRGYVPARATAVDHARGEWLVMVDSDDELVAGALGRLERVITTLPPGVGVIRSRVRRDDGSISPGVLPERPVTGYEDRLRWCEAIYAQRVGSDAGHCIHRSVFARVPLFCDRRGALEPLWELRVSRATRSLWLDEVLGLVHTDAPNSHGRGAVLADALPRLLSEAPDSLWMAETLLCEHDLPLRRMAPRYRAYLLENAAANAFLVGARRRGLRHAAAGVRAGRPLARLLALAGLGILGPRPLAHGKLAARRLRALRGRGS
jgi:hypothetical protein